MKKIGYVFMITMICFLFIGCGKNQSNIQEPLSDVMKKLYENISEDEMPLLETVEVTKDIAVFLVMNYLLWQKLKLQRKIKNII